jgi:hypothetical protein
MQNNALLIQLQPRGGYPTKDDPPPFPLAFCGADRIVALEVNRKDKSGEFLRDANGNIVWLRWGGRIRVRAR